jgi:hypothetical protein
MNMIDIYRFVESKRTSSYSVDTVEEIDPVIKTLMVMASLSTEGTLSVYLLL